MSERNCETCDNHDDNGLSGENACSLSRSYRVSCYYGRRQHWEPTLEHLAQMKRANLPTGDER